MILHTLGGTTACVGQLAHSWVSGRLAREWRPEPAPRAEFILGAEQHDIGWADWDREPEVDPDSGLPVPFHGMPITTHLQIWSAGPQKLITQSPYAALLVSLHGHALYARRERTPEIQAFLTEQELLQADLIQRLGEEPANARHNQQLLWALDYLALVGLLPEWTPGDVTVGDTTFHVTTTGERRLTVDPWPFASPALTFSYPARRLDGRATSTRDLRDRLARAPFVSVPVTWAPR